MATDPRSGAARRLRDLALDYIERSHRAQADLVRSFEADAEGLAAQVGEVVVEDDDDERLTFSARGQFQGSVQDRDPNAGRPEAEGAWRTLASADDVVEFYDPVDLFDDLAEAIADAFPEIATAALDGRDEPGPGPASKPAVPSTDPWFARVGSAEGPSSDPAAPAPPLESASMTILRDLHAAGVFSDEEFAARKAELEPPS